MKIYEAINERKEAEAALQENLEKIEAYSQALDSEMEKGHQMQKNFQPAEILQKNSWEVAAFFSQPDKLLVIFMMCLSFLIIQSD